MVRDHTKLHAFRLADDVAFLIYTLTARFPREEIYGLTSQMRRASVSIGSTLAEGRGRLNSAEFRQFLGVA